MHRNTRSITISGGQHFQVNGDYNYHAHSQFASNDDAAARKREGKCLLFIPGITRTKQLMYLSSLSAQDIVRTHCAGCIAQLRRALRPSKVPPTDAQGNPAQNYGLGKESA